jgi:hypothetical protein
MNKTVEEKQVSKAITSNNRQNKQYASIFCFDFVGNHCNLNGKNSKFRSNMEVNKDTIWTHINI